MNILEDIFANKRREVAAAKQHLPAGDLRSSLPGRTAELDFATALRDPRFPAPRLIAEVKHRSPSKGILAKPFDPPALAKAYASNGAAAISVLTDEKFFGGSLHDLRQIAALELGVPLLRKDFIFDTYQLLEARWAGAHAALLIVGMLDNQTLAHLIKTAEDLNLTALVEVHDEVELDRALEAGAEVIGINNRDLRDFSVTLETTLQLRPRLPLSTTVVAESGIKTREDIHRLADAGVHAMLIGEALVTAADVVQQMRQLTRVSVR